jgi:hypothetical protein
VKASCDESFLKEAIPHYEKIDYSDFCAFRARLDVGVLLKPTRDDHDDDASNHCHHTAAAAD